MDPLIVKEMIESPYLHDNQVNNFIGKTHLKVINHAKKFINSGEDDLFTKIIVNIFPVFGTYKKVSESRFVVEKYVITLNGFSEKKYGIIYTKDTIEFTLLWIIMEVFANLRDILCKKNKELEGTFKKGLEKLLNCLTDKYITDEIAKLVVHKSNITLYFANKKGSYDEFISFTYKY